MLCENLVIKALKNLMPHFIFLAPNKLEPLCHLCCICLTKYKLTISSPLNTRATPHATQLQSPVSSCHCKYMHIIENRQWGTPCTWYRSYPITKMTRQAENEHLSNLLMYHGNMVLFLSLSTFLNVSLFL